MAHGELARPLVLTPLVLARDRVLQVPGPVGELLPGGVLRRGTVVRIDGAPGAGATSLALGLAAAATGAGEWAAAVDPTGTLGGLAVAEAGVDLGRFALVRGVPPERWSVVVAALLDGVSVVVVDVPRGVTAGDARRLVARARERGGVLTALGAWPGEAALRLHAEGGAWSGVSPGGGVLAGRVVQARVEAREASGHRRAAALAG